MDEFKGEAQYQLGGRRQMPAGSKVAEGQVVRVVEVLMGRHVPKHVLAGGGEEVWDEAVVLLHPGLLGAP